MRMSTCKHFKIYITKLCIYKVEYLLVYAHTTLYHVLYHTVFYTAAHCSILAQLE